MDIPHAVYKSYESKPHISSLTATHLYCIFFSLVASRAHISTMVHVEESLQLPRDFEGMTSHRKCNSHV